MLVVWKNFPQWRGNHVQQPVFICHEDAYIYMGEGIGMVDPDYDSMEDYVDVRSLNAYQSLLTEGQSSEAAFRIIKAKSRDNSRTPMQWDDSVNAGFTAGLHG